MAASRGNTPKQAKKQSMAEELMSLVNIEEYSDPVLGLHEDEYLTKAEVASMRKMISGKLWIHSVIDKIRVYLPVCMNSLVNKSLNQP